MTNSIHANSMYDYQLRAENVLARIDQLASISEDDTCITRTFGTDAFLRASQLIVQWMSEIGLQTRVDSIGNIRGRLVSSKPGAKTLVIASHLDTVVNAGKFDGPMGVIMGLDLLEQLVESKQEIPFHIELIAFCDEEGCRFHTTYLGSKVVAGAFEHDLLAKKDALGTTLLEVLQAMGADVAQLAIDAVSDWLGYFEIHIEQGPVLYERNVPVALVTSIAGQKRIEIRFQGVAGHAGTVPMAMRQDALCAAAEFVLEAERLAVQTPNLVATVGKLNVTNAASNVVPGEVWCSLDMRSSDTDVLVQAYQTLQQRCLDIGYRRNVTIDWKLIQETAPVACDQTMENLLAQSIDANGYEVIRLVSGAGHDGVPISNVAPISMLFVRCFEGISHNPLENTELSDMAATLRVADTYIAKLIAWQTLPDTL